MKPYKLSGTSRERKKKKFPITFFLKFLLNVLMGCRPKLLDSDPINFYPKFCGTGAKSTFNLNLKRERGLASAPAGKGIEN